MRYIAAYLLLQTAGNSSPSAADIKKVIAAGGVEVDEDRLSSLISELEGKDINTLINEGNSKLASVRGRLPTFSSVLTPTLGPIWWRWRRRCTRCWWCRPCCCCREGRREEGGGEGSYPHSSHCALPDLHPRRSPTTTWASVCSTNCTPVS